MSVVPEPTSSQRRGDRIPAAQNADGSAGWFFLLVLALVSPLLVLDELLPYQIIPGVPVAGFGVVCPTLAAVILVARTRGAAGVKALLGRALDVRHITQVRWAAASVLIMPCVTAVALWIQQQTATEPPAFEVSARRLAGLAVAFLLGGIAEELGWTAYALEALQSRRSALASSLLVGGACSVFHYTALWQASSPGSL